MARRGRPKAAGYKFKNVDKTYRRYLKVYYNKAKTKWNKLHHRKGNAKLPKYVNKNALKNTMYDKPLTKSQFRVDYKNYKRELVEEGKSSDPIQYIVSDQAYEYSYKQYKGFKSAVKKQEFKDLTGMNLENVSELEFRTGQFKDTEYYRAADAYYHAMKKEAEDLGFKGKEVSRYAHNKVGEMFFDRDETLAFWEDSK